MGSIIYNHLNDSLLLDKSLIDDQFHGVSEAELVLALKQYREFCIAHFDDLLAEVSPESGEIRLFIGENTDDRLLRQGAFYLHAVILTDPLFKLTEPKHEYSSTYSKAFNLPTKTVINREELVKAAKKLLSYRPLVASNYVRFFPTSLESEAKSEIPLYAPSDGFKSILPPNLLSLYQEAAKVRSVTATPQGVFILKDLKLGRRISVDFDGEESGRSFGFDLLQQHIVSWNEEAREAQLAVHMPNTPPSSEMFELWVNQSINSAADMHFKALSDDIRWSARFGSQYLTRSKFSASVLDSKNNVSLNDIQSATSGGLLNLNLSVFDRISMDKLMAVRRDEEAFHRFRLQLEKHFRELRMEVDPERRFQKTENAMHELIEIQLTEVDSAIRRLKRKGILTGAGALASLVAATATSGTSLFATMYAAYVGYKTFDEYRIAVKESPAYFMWKAIGRK